MVTNELLETKYRTQKLMDKQAGHDLRTYVKNTRRTVQAVEKKYGLKFRYEPVKKEVASSANVAHENTALLITPEATVGQREKKR